MYQDVRFAGRVEEDRVGVDREPAGDDGGRGEGLEHFPVRIQRAQQGLVM